MEVCERGKYHVALYFPDISAYGRYLGLCSEVRRTFDLLWLCLCSYFDGNFKKYKLEKKIYFTLCLGGAKYPYCTLDYINKLLIRDGGYFHG